MKYTIQGLLITLVSLLIISSCKNPDGVGLDIDPEDAIKGNLIDTSTIRAYTVREDSIISTDSYLPQNPVGYFRDPVMGITDANIALGYGAPPTSIDFGTAPVLDSAVLILPLGNEFYGDTLNSTYTVRVQQLAENYTVGGVFYNTRKWQVNPTILGSITRNKFNMKDSVVIQDIITGKTDGTKKVAPQIRIPINAAFINNFFTAPSGTFADATSMMNAFKGMYVSFNKNVGGAGGILSVKVPSVVLQIFYKKPGTGTAVDTLSQAFPLSSGASEISHDYTGTPIATQLANPTQQYNTLYLQPMSGVKTRLNFPYLKNLQSLGKVTVNKAELVVMSDPTTVTPFYALPRTYLYADDIAGQRVNIPDHSTNDPRLLFDQLIGGTYIKDRQQYVYNITAYVQDIISGKLKQYNTYIAPAFGTVDRQSDALPERAGGTAARVVIGSPTSGSYRMKLNIYYTLKD